MLDLGQFLGDGRKGDWIEDGDLLTAGLNESQFFPMATGAADSVQGGTGHFGDHLAGIGQLEQNATGGGLAVFLAQAQQGVSNALLYPFGSQFAVAVLQFQKAAGDGFKGIQGDAGVLLHQHLHGLA